MKLSDVLFSANCGNVICGDPNCNQMVVEYKDRWYITFGHAGFNSSANNRLGYSSKAKALGAVLFYLYK